MESAAGQRRIPLTDGSIKEKRRWMPKAYALVDLAMLPAKYTEKLDQLAPA